MSVCPGVQELRQRNALCHHSSANAELLQQQSHELRNRARTLRAAALDLQGAQQKLPDLTRLHQTDIACFDQHEVLDAPSLCMCLSSARHLQHAEHK